MFSYRHRKANHFICFIFTEQILWVVGHSITFIAVATIFLLWEFEGAHLFLIQYLRSSELHSVLSLCLQAWRFRELEWF